MNQENQLSTLSVKERNALALHENEKAKTQLDEMLAGSLLLQKLYGKQPESIEAINRMFHVILAKYPGNKIIMAFETWLQRSQEFPTPADIIGLIKRNGKPPLAESQYITIMKKDGEDRTDAEWRYIKDYEAERDAGWDDIPDEKKLETIIQENMRLRNQLHRLTEENKRLIRLMQEPKPKPLSPRFTHDEMVENTIRAMREGGAPESDIEEFMATTDMQASFPPI